MTFSVGQRVFLTAIAALFAIGTSLLSYDNARTRDLAPRFHWPDETTYHFFATRVARGESLAVSEPRNVAAGNLIHPRTANVRADGAIVPGAYLGLPLWYGLIGRVFGERAMLFVTPILAALGLLAFASIIRRLAGASVALIATVLLALHPSLWLFTATAFLPNAPFVALVLLGFAVLLREHSNAPNTGSECSENYSRIRGIRMRFAAFGCPSGALHWFLAGLLIGLALTIRTHELVWVLAVTLWAFLRCSGGLQAATWRAEARRYTGSIAVLIIGLALPFLPILVLNAQLYGSPFTTGYALLQDGGAAPTEFASSLFSGWFTALVAPFGWYPIEAFARFWQYLVVPYPWAAALAVTGFLSTILSHFRTKMRKEILSQGWVAMGTIAFTVWLILYYGSWTIADPLVRETNVLTISYVRYWLPITIVLAFWAAVGLQWVLDRCATRWRPHIAMLVLLGIALVSFRTVVADPIEGLLRQRQALAEHRTRARAVIAATEPSAVIISHRMDKVFYPERAVVHASEDTSGDPNFLSRIRALVGSAPAYWYASSSIAIPGIESASIGTMPFGERLLRVDPSS